MVLVVEEEAEEEKRKKKKVNDNKFSIDFDFFGLGSFEEATQRVALMDIEQLKNLQSIVL